MCGHGGAGSWIRHRSLYHKKPPVPRRRERAAKADSHQSANRGTRAGTHKKDTPPKAVVQTDFIAVLVALFGNVCRIADKCL